VTSILYICREQNYHAQSEEDLKGPITLLPASIEKGGEKPSGEREKTSRNQSFRERQHDIWNNASHRRLQRQKINNTQAEVQYERESCRGKNLTVAT